MLLFKLFESKHNFPQFYFTVSTNFISITKNFGASLAERVILVQELWSLPEIPKMRYGASSNKAVS